MNFRAVVVGPHGSGKSTFLEHLSEKLTRGGYLITALTLNLEKPNLSSEDRKALFDLGKNQMGLVES